MIVYWDILFIINTLSDYIILNSVSKVTYIYTNKFRILTASFLGGIYGIFLLDENFYYIYFWEFKILFSFVLILSAFKINNIKLFIKLIFNFYIISFASSGAAQFFNNIFGVIIMKDGIVNIKSNAIITLLSVFAGCFFTVNILKRINRRNIKFQDKKFIDIYFEGKKMTVEGIMDTGNLLLDPITNYPVIVVSLCSIKKGLSDELYNFLNEKNSLNSVINRKYMKRIRLIPYKTVGDYSYLKGFRPDYIIIKDKERRIVRDVIIAVSHKKFENESNFSAILNPQL